MSIIVQKFGGSSVATIEKLKAVATRVIATRDQGHQVAVVVSAMGGTTDDLQGLAREVSKDMPARELSVLLSAGEQISIALLTSAIRAAGRDAVSLSGPQCGILTNHAHVHARIIEVRPFRVIDELARGRIVVVAGFQGESYLSGEVTTLGRGGSDTTAVALAAALGAERCEIYSDVDGIYSADPRVVPAATRLDEVGYEDMQELARLGACVLNPDAVEFARREGIAVYARHARHDKGGTVIRRVDGALNEPLRELEAAGITGVSGRKDVVWLRSASAPGVGVTPPETLEHVLEVLSECEVLDGDLRPGEGTLDIVAATENLTDADVTVAMLASRAAPYLDVDTDVGTASAIGPAVGGRSDALFRVQRVLERAKIEVRRVLSTRESVTCVVRRADVDRAVRALHRAFVEDDRPTGASGLDRSDRREPRQAPVVVGEV